MKTLTRTRIILLLIIQFGCQSALSHKYAPTSMGAYYGGTKSAGYLITFTGSGSHDNDSQTGGATPRWSWDFEYSGSFSEDVNSTNSLVTWTYGNLGIYTVAVIYYDDDNQQGDLYTFPITIGSGTRFDYPLQRPKTISQRSYYNSVDGNDGEFNSTDPNFITSVIYTSQSGFSDFTSTAGWSFWGDVTFNFQKSDQTTVRIGTQSGEQDSISKTAGIGDVVTRVDFYPQYSPSGTAHVLSLDGANYRFCVQYLAPTGEFRMQIITAGVVTYPHNFLLNAGLYPWLTVEVEKRSDGNCTAWIYPRGSGRDYAQAYSLAGFPVNWNPDVRSRSDYDYCYLANHYVGSFSQSTTYVDGIGRVMQEHDRKGNGDVLTTFEFDGAGRACRTWNPFFMAGHHYDPDFAAHAMSRYGISNPYREIQYYADPLSRVHYQIPLGSTTSDEYIETQYGHGVVDGRLHRYSQTLTKLGTQTDWVTNRVYYDRLGRSVKTLLLEGINPRDSTRTFYTMLGNPFQVVDPKGLLTSATYNSLGQLKSKTTPDAGTTNRIYDKAGRLRFALDAEGDTLTPDRISYWQYDVLGRVIETGHYSFGWNESLLQGYADTDPSWPPIQSGWRKVVTYEGSTAVPYMQGRFSRVLVNEDADYTTELREDFSYDQEGNVTVKTVTAYDFNSTAYSTTYEYDHLGRNVKITYPTDGINPPQIVYTYDQMGLISAVGTVADNDYFASYIYEDFGAVKQEYIGTSGLWNDYSYDARCRLTSISQPFLYMGESLTYSTGGYGGAGYYHGLIASASYSNELDEGPQQYIVQYKYDYQGRLKVADNTAANQFDLGVGSEITYDNNGNFLQVKQGSTTKTYSYFPNSNKVQNTDGSGADYTYTPNGNIYSSAPRGITSVVYDPLSQLPTNISLSNRSIDLQYEGNGERVIKKDVYNGNTTKCLYLRGMNDYPLVQKDQSGIERYYIYGPTGAIAMQLNGTNYFFIKDHLGSTRVLINGSNYTPAAWYDYMPFGEVMWSMVNVDPKYRFIGQEFDSETNLHNFRARLYDGSLGRFYSVDPSGQGFSPFAYCGNNPVLFIDRDGRIFGIDDALFFGLCLFGGYVGGAIANHNLNPFDWDWKSTRTWNGIGVGALSGAFLMSGIGVGGAYGTAVGRSALTTVLAYTSGVEPHDLWKAALVGFGTGLFAATGGATLAEKGMIGRLGAQALSTSLSSVGSNWIYGRPLFSSIRIGLGPLTLRFGKGQKLLNLGDNFQSGVMYSMGFANLLTGGKVETDSRSLSLNFTGGWISKIMHWVDAEAGGFGALFNAAGRNIVEEGHHVWQTRFFENDFLPVMWLWNAPREWVMGRKAYRDNFFEFQAREIQPWYSDQPSN